MAASDCVKLGDIVTLRNLKMDAYVSAEGIVFDDLFVTGSALSFDDNLFQVCLQRQYSAARELEEYLVASKDLPDFDASPLTNKYLQALQRGRDNENRLNETYMSQKWGNKVFYGDIVQLMHLKSKKYLTVVPNRVSACERENLSLCLNAAGSPFSWLQILPRFKIDRRGDRILNEAEVLLKLSERNNEFIHCADRIRPGHPREINSSLEATSWRMKIFQNAGEQADLTLLLPSQLFYIHDPETRANLALLEPPSDLAMNDESTVDDDDDDSTFEADRRRTRVVIEPVVDSEPNSNSLWYIEAKTQAVGTPVLFKTDAVRLRHFVTGKYLLLSKPTKKNVQKNILNLEPYVVGATSEQEPVGSMISLHQMFGGSNFLLNEKVVQLSCEHTYLERGDSLGPDCGDRNLCRGTRQKGSALNFVLKRYNPFAGQDEAEAKAFDVHICASIRTYFSGVVASTSRPDQEQPSAPISVTIWPKANKDDLTKYDQIMTRVLHYLEGYPISYDPAKDIVILKNITGLRAITSQRKSLFRELGCVAVVFEMVSAMLAITENWFFLGWEAQTKVPEKIDAKKALQTMVNSVTGQFMRLLLECIRDHFSNQTFVASYIHIILRLVGREPVAAELISEMLSRNKELQETKIGRREVSLFVDQMKVLRMNSMYLELLRACCSCEDKAVLKNQRMVCELLFPHLGNVFLFLTADFSEVGEQIAWPASPVFPLPEGGEDTTVLAARLLRGLPVMRVTWDSAAGEFAAESLFGSHEVPLEEVFRHYGPRTVMLPGKGSFKSVESSPAQQRKGMVSKYLVEVLLLAAELCLDRYCTGITKFSEMFPYDLLVGLLRSDHISEPMASAVARLLRNVHINQEPNPCDALPRTSRLWNTLEADVNASLVSAGSVSSFDQSGRLPHISHLPCVDGDRINRHVILQYILSSYLRDMRGARRWEASSVEMVRLLHELVKLRFYGTGPRLRELIRLVVQVLKRPRKTTDSADIGGILGIQKGSSFFAKSRSSKSLHDDNSDASGKSGFKESTVAELEDKPPRWEEGALSVLMSVKVLIGMLGLVVVALALNGYVFVTGSTDPVYTFVDYGVTLVFIIELTLRTYCYFVVKGDMINFYTDPFTIIDYTVVFLDILLFALGSVLGAVGGFTKSLRLLRLLRLLRIMRAGRIIKSIVGIKEEDEVSWSMPVRYVEPDPHEVDTMIELVRVLHSIQKIIEDRNITLLLVDFHTWVNEDGDHAHTPGEVFAQLLPSMADLSIISAESTDVFLDLMMYSSQPLCQAVHTALMEQHVSLAILVENARKVQLLVKPFREKQYRHIQNKIAQLESTMERHDDWGSLMTPEARALAEEAIGIVHDLTESCRVRRRVLEFDQVYKPDRQAQNMLRASGCLRICNIIIEKLVTVGLDSLSDMGVYNTKLLSACNELLAWFLTENADNQEMAFEHFVTYLSIIDSGVGSHNVIKALFRGNEKLMRQVPVSRISEFIDLICDEGRFPQYLCLLGSVVSVGDSNIAENQYEIIRQMTIPTRVKKCLAFFCPVVSVEYTRKLKLMQPYIGKKDVDVDELPAELAYHVELLGVLSGCTEGDTNITTVETKVQGMYHYNDIVEAMLDPNSLQIVKNRLSLFFYNAMVDVEMVVPGFHRARCVWLFLESCIKVFQIAKDELRLIERQGWDSPAANRQRIEYMIICAMIVGGFFGRYFDPLVFYRDDGTNLPDEEKLTPQQVNNLVVQLFDGIKALYDLDSPILSGKHKSYFYIALVELNKIKTIPSVLAPNDHFAVPTRKEDEELDLVLSDGKQSSARIFREFLDSIQESEAATSVVNEEFQSMIAKIEKLPSVKEPIENVDVRYEAVIEKMVSHARDSIYTVTHNMNPEKRMDPEETRTVIWVIRMFRTMIENRWGMTIYERDDDGGEEQDEASEELVGVLNSRGATALCLDLIAVGIDRELVTECIKLCVAMLFKEGGALEVQETMYNYLSSTDSSLFFKQLRSIIRGLMDWHEKNGIVVKPSEERPLEPGEQEAEDIPQDIIVVRFMQLMCEGHYNPNQDIMREQKANKSGSINMLDDLADYMICLVRMPCATSTEAALAVSATCLEVIQGPCEGNQEYFALNTQMIEMINRLMRMPAGVDAEADDEMELKKTGIDIIQGLLEGQAKKPAVYEKVLSVLHLDIIQLFCGGGDSDGEELSEVALSLQTECLVLIQMLCDFKPGLREELELPDLDSLVGSSVACVEVMWRGELQRRFFNVPDICSDLAKSAKDNLVEEVDRSSQENKLIDLLFRARGLYKEIQHQQLLREYKLAGVFSRSNQDYATWICFWIACAVNFIFLLYFHSNHCDQLPYYDTGLDACGEPILESAPTTAAAVLNIMQLFFSSFTLLLFLVVRVPVLFQSQLAQGHSALSSALTTALDPMTMYYFIYVIVASLGLSTRPLISFLLLDLIVKNSYARDVFIAIVFPWKALFMSSFLMMVVTFIFTYYYFIHFNTSQHLPFPEDCETLWKCYLFMLGYGKEGDISMYLEIDSYNRWVADFMFCLLLKFTLWNVVRGINVDTFAELRAIKMERLEDTTEVCFICGIDKLTFDRNDTDHGFAKHIRTEHNMWNYLYFFIYLWEQDKDDDDGLEQYVRRCLDANDISWFPVGRALCLNVDESDDVEELAGQVRGDLISMNKSILAKISELEEKIGNKVMSIDSLLNVNDGGSVASHESESNMSRSVSAFRQLSSRLPSSRVRGPRLTRSATVNMREYAIKHASQVLMEPVELLGIETLFDHRQHGKVSCRVNCKAGVYDIPRSMHKDGIHIKFEPNEVCVCSSLHAGVNQQLEKVKVQIYVEDFGGIKKFVGLCEISLDELTPAATVRLEKPFLASFGGKSVEGRFVCLAFTMKHQLDEPSFMPGASTSADTNTVGTGTVTGGGSQVLHKSRSSIM